MSKRKVRNPAVKRPITAWVLIVLHILLGIGAVGGGGMLMFAPDGSLLGLPVNMLEGTPFRSYLIPGFILLTILGIFPLLVAYSLITTPKWRWPNAINPFKRIHWAWSGSLAVGVALLVWIITQMTMLGALAAIQWIYLTWGIVTLALTL